MNILKITTSLVTLLCLFLISYKGTIHSNEALFAYGIGFSLAIFFYFTKIKWKNNYEIITWKQLLLFSVPALGSIIVKLSLDVVSQFLIKEQFGFVELSKYAIANRVLLSVKIFSGLLMMFFPVLYYREIDKKNKVFLNRIRLILIVIIFTIGSLGIVFGEEIYWLMGASKYINDVEIYNVLVITEFIFVVGGLWGIYLAYTLKTYISLTIYLIGAILNVVLLKVYLPIYGIYVAPYSILASNLLISALMIIMSYKKEKIHLNS